MQNINYETITKENEVIVAKSKNEILENINEEQLKFIKTDLGKAINGGIDVGLKILLPDVIEDEVINIKNSLITEGFSAAVDTAIEEATNLGKSVIGIVTGGFENISQIKKAIKKGGLIDSISDILDSGIKWLKDKEIINKDVANAIKKGKNKILDSIDKSVGSSLDNQIEAIEKIDGYIEKWKQYYEEQNFSGMEYQYKKIEEYLGNVVPIEETLVNARKLENLHELIKNKGKDFNLSEEEKELAEFLVK